MRSVIDEIAAAEQKAEEIRLNAASAARESINLAREEAQASLARLEEEEREISTAQMDLARAEGERLAKEQLDTMKRETDELCAKAESKTGDAVSYLVNKVLKTA